SPTAGAGQGAGRGRGEQGLGGRSLSVPADDSRSGNSTGKEHIGVRPQAGCAGVLRRVVIGERGGRGIARIHTAGTLGDRKVLSFLSAEAFKGSGFGRLSSTEKQW